MPAATVRATSRTMPMPTPAARWPYDVVAVLDALGVERSAYFGHSMGGAIGILLAHHAPDRFSALGIGAVSPRSGALRPGEGFVPLLREGSSAMLTAWQELGPISPELTERILAIDCDAIIALLEADWDRNELDSAALARLPGRYRFFMGDGGGASWTSNT